MIILSSCASGAEANKHTLSKIGNGFDAAFIFTVSVAILLRPDSLSQLLLILYWTLEVPLKSWLGVKYITPASCNISQLP